MTIRPVSTTGQAAVVVRNLVKRFGRKTAVDGVSFEVPTGTVFGLLGPNGAGKSTTVKILVGLVAPSSGHVSIFGGSPADATTRASIGYVPEQFRFPEWMTAREFVQLHASLANLPASEVKHRLDAVLDIVGLGHRTNDVLSTFSKGMLQRIGIAQALVADPYLVILDEPTSALDPIGRRDVRDLILRLRRDGVTVILNSHLLGEVERICDRVAILDRGRVVEAGLIGELLGEHVDLEVRSTVQSSEMLAVLERRWSGRSAIHRDETGVVGIRVALTNSDDIPEVARALHEANVPITALIPHRRTLEDLFLTHVRNDETGATLPEAMNAVR